MKHFFVLNQADLILYHVRMITYNKVRIITVEVFKLYGLKDCDLAAARLRQRKVPLCSDDRL